MILEVLDANITLLVPLYKNSRKWTQMVIVDIARVQRKHSQGEVDQDGHNTMQLVLRQHCLAGIVIQTFAVLVERTKRVTAGLYGPDPEGLRLQQPPVRK